ncbi:hypothetical protein TNIN_256051 [Trichonephila inaurata madagascariensis]|uniref:Uncharacterized protein n=1 Tax=Trichonephila inaurata madagascariensis TaxID=2747483 RepID=A0A8X6JXR7_9ARAC|nr:hypothetical protein TNIN_256051 [Trichonephila inaurata madagascariensis]
MSTWGPVLQEKPPETHLSSCLEEYSKKYSSGFYRRDSLWIVGKRMKWRNGIYKNKKPCSGAGIEPTDTAVNRITLTLTNAVTHWIRNNLSDKAAVEEDLMLAIWSWRLHLPMRSTVTFEDGRVVVASDICIFRRMGLFMGLLHAVLVKEKSLSVLQIYEKNERKVKKRKCYWNVTHTIQMTIDRITSANAETTATWQALDPPLLQPCVKGNSGSLQGMASSPMVVSSLDSAICRFDSCS